MALGRALIRKPRIFLMDEPLSNLDLKLRETMRLELGRLHQRLGITIVYVTHDQVEAMTLSTDVAVMNNGVLQQLDRPERIYSEPANTFVAKFIGSPSMNLFRGIYTNRSVKLAGPHPVCIPLPFEVALEDGAPIIVGARPHELSFQPAGPNCLPVRVSFTERMGRSDFVVCAAGGTDLLHESDVVQVETEAGASVPSESIQSIGFKIGALKLFSIHGSAIRGSSEHERTVRRGQA